MSDFTNRLPVEYRAFTPGPWATSDDEIVARDDQHIATVELCDGINPTEWQANMRLIAAAPTLLMALRETLDYWDSCQFSDCAEGCDCIVQSVQAAIAKAEGQS